MAFVQALDDQAALLCSAATIGRAEGEVRRVDGPGFHVDIEALERAGKGIARTVDDQEKSQLQDVCAEPGAYGDDAVHGALKNFCDRWNEGIDLLIEDAGKVSDILNRAARAYRAVDSAAASRLTTDPGTQVTGG